MNMDQIINVTFYQGGQPPVSTPVAIQALNTQVIVWGYYGCQITATKDWNEDNFLLPGTVDTIRVAPCDQNWNWNRYAETQIQFQILDANGRGVPDIVTNGQHSVTVAFYPSLIPDGSMFGGYLSINDQMPSQSNPLLLYPDANGIVTVSLEYTVDPTDNYLELCQAAQLYLNVYYPPIPYGIGVKVKNYPSKPWNNISGLIWSMGGHGVTGQGPASMGNMQLNTINAQIAGTSIPAAQTLCSCGLNVKMLPLIKA